MSRRNLFDEVHVRQYPQRKTNWYVWDLLFGQLPVLACRNNNEYDHKYTRNDYHSTFNLFLEKKQCRLAYANYLAVAQRP